MKNRLLTLTVALSLGGAMTVRATEPPAKPSGPFSPTDIGTRDFDDEEIQATQEILQKYLDPTDMGFRKGYSVDCNPDPIVANLPAKLSVPVEQKRRILVITYNVDIHEQGAGGNLVLLRAAAKKYDAFELTEVNTLKGIDAKMLSGFDAVYLNNITKTWCENDTQLGRKFPQLVEATMKSYKDPKNFPMKHSAEEEERFRNFHDDLLPKYVENGGGVFVMHASLQVFGGKLVGGQYGSHAMGPHAADMFNKNGYGVKIVEPNNPLAKAFSEALDTKLFTELYNIIPLAKAGSSAEAFRPIIDLDETKESAGGQYKAGSNIIGIRSSGKGRVYYCGVGGHQWSVFAIPAFTRALLDGLLYCTGDLKVPAVQTSANPASITKP